MTQPSRPSLLSHCTSGGCGAKIGPAELSRFLTGLPVNDDPNLLVGFDHADDAAVYRISDDAAIVSTVDFFPPMVDDPRLFGKIAAANALSDIYAMGGTALFALNLVCFPQKLDKEILGDILAGGAEKVAEAGAVLAGGHSIYDPEIKYGLAVTGRVHPDRVRRNRDCQAGDALILTKPLGSGLIMAAARVDLATPEQFAAAADTMTRLNKYAAEKTEGYPVHAITDITGFGLMVHAAEMAGDSHSLVLDFNSLPLLPGALAHAEAYLATAAGQRNRNHIAPQVDVSALTPAQQEIVFDPQTSGGLLISVAMDRAEALVQAIRQDDPQAAIIGQVVPREKAAVTVL